MKYNDVNNKYNNKKYQKIFIKDNGSGISHF